MVPFDGLILNHIKLALKMDQKHFPDFWKGLNQQDLNKETEKWNRCFKVGKPVS